MSEILFTCLKCEQHYNVDEPTLECPVCGWRSPNYRNEGFHWRDGMFFKLLEDGSVRIRLFATRASGEFLEGDDDEPVREWIIPGAEWDSIVNAVNSQRRT